MRICTQISTGKIIEMQSEARAGTLIENAVAQGVNRSDLSEEVVTPAEYKARMDIQNPPHPPVDKTDIDNVNKHIKALALVVAQWSGKTVPQLRAAFKSAMDSIP